MQAVYMLVAKASKDDGQGNIHFQSVLNRIVTTQLPHGVSDFPVYIHLLAQPYELGKQVKLKVEVIDEDGTIIGGIPPISIVINGKNQTPFFVSPCLHVPQVVFRKAGLHTVNLFLDGEMAMSYPFHVLAATA